MFTSSSTLESPAPWLRDHPARWRAGTLDVAGLRRAADALRARPGFDSAVRHFAACWQAAYDSNPVLVSAMRNNARYLMLVACIRLDHLRDPLHPGESITPTRLIAFYERIGREGITASPWRVKDMLAHARTRGLLQRVPQIGDARLRPLEPTPLLREALACWVAGFLRGLEPVLPLPEAPERMVERPGFVAELFTYRVSALVEDRYAINQGLPALRWITDREKGYHLFLSLMRGVELQGDGSAVTHCVPQVIADRARLARTTARNFLNGCIEQGWISPAPGHHLVLHPGFVDEALHWFGLEFVWMYTLAVAAWNRVQPQSPP